MASDDGAYPQHGAGARRAYPDQRGRVPRRGGAAGGPWSGPAKQRKEADVMRPRRWMCGTGVLVLALSLVAWAGGSKAEAQALRMKFAHFADEGHPGHLAAKMFVGNVEKRTNGQI